MHGAIGLGLVFIGRTLGLSLNPQGVLIGSLLPDLDFLLLVPFVGRQRGHRTAMHSPAFHLIAAYLFRQYGFWSVLAGAMLHLAIDDVHAGKPPGVAWLWPFSKGRIKLLPTWARCS